MALNVTTPARERPVPRSPLARSNPLMSLLADLDDARLARKHAAAALRELQGLDARMLRDIGLNHAVLEEILRHRKPRKRPELRSFLGPWRKLHNSALFRSRSRPTGSRY